MQAKRKKISKKKNVGGRPALPEEERRDRTLDMVLAPLQLSVSTLKAKERYAEDVF